MYLQIHNVVAQQQYSNNINGNINRSRGAIKSTRNAIAVPTSHDHTHIELIDVKCDTSAMIVKIVFEETFSGIIYSQGYFKDPKCR